jgi:hypothetical protein
MGYFSQLAADICDRYESGQSANSIANTLSLSIDQVNQILNDFASTDDYDDSMDGDFDSAMTSAGFGTDEDYGYYGE